MSTSVFALVMLSAVCHASWNFAARKVKGNYPVLWLSYILACVLMLPFAIIAICRIGIGRALDPHTMVCILATGAWHALYFHFLSHAYQKGEISVVYPIARGSGVALTALGASVLLDETITLPGGWA